MLGAEHLWFVPHEGLQSAVLGETINIIKYLIVRVKQSLPVHPLIHVQVSGAKHLWFIPHEGLQIAILRKYWEDVQMNIFVRVEQFLPVHPLTHGQVLGAEHLLFVPHEGLQIAKLSYHKAQYINNKLTLR